MSGIALRVSAYFLAFFCLPFATSISAASKSIDAGAAIGFVSVAAGSSWRLYNSNHLAQSAKDTPLKARSAIFEGDTLATDTNAHLYIRFKDNGFLSLRPSTKVTIERYHVVASDPKQNDIRIIVHEGVARSVTGEGGHAARDRFQLRTPLAVVGIRGTDFTVYSRNDLTRVSVRSGGVVVAPASLCSGVSSGPCSNGAAELFAGQNNTILQVTADASATQLIEQVDPQLMPDVQAPALDKEDGAGLSAARANVIDGTLFDVVSDLKDSKLPDLAAVPAPIIPAARWGRWQSAASGAESGAVLRALVGTDTIQAFAGDYVLIKEARNLPMLPEIGRFNFTLGNYDAQFVSGEQRMPATLSDASLIVDFASRRFDVGFIASGTPGRYGFGTSGSVGAKGQMQGDISAPFFRFDGILTGAAGEQAASVFTGYVNPALQLQGAATWQAPQSLGQPPK